MKPCYSPLVGVQTGTIACTPDRALSPGGCESNAAPKAIPARTWSAKCESPPPEGLSTPIAVQARFRPEILPATERHHQKMLRRLADRILTSGPLLMNFPELIPQPHQPAFAFYSFTAAQQPAVEPQSPAEKAKDRLNITGSLLVTLAVIRVVELISCRRQFVTLLSYDDLLVLGFSVLAGNTL